MDKNNEIYTKIEKCRGIIRQAEKELYDITIKSKNITPEIEEIQNEISYLNGWMISNCPEEGILNVEIIEKEGRKESRLISAEGGSIDFNKKDDTETTKFKEDLDNILTSIQKIRAKMATYREKNRVN